MTTSDRRPAGLAGQYVSTCQALSHLARHSTEAVAIVHRDLSTTYRELADLVLGTMDDLTSAGIRPGHVVGVEIGDRYLHLLILLAAEAIGVTTMSLRLSELGPPAHLERLCDRIIVSQPPPHGMDPHKFLSMPPDWPTNILVRLMDDHRLRELERAPAPDSLARLIKSSGTTGAPKVMGMTHRVEQRAIEKGLLYAPPWVTAHTDYLCLYPFLVRAVYARLLATLQRGGTIHLTGSDVVWDLIQAGIGNYVVFVAGDLERLLRTAPRGNGPFPLYVDVVGAAVPLRLRQEIRAKLSEHFIVNYGSNESHRISVVDDDNVGTLFPGVCVRIEDEKCSRLPIGQTGTICIQSDTMTDGYVGAPDLTRAVFSEGWFRTSDLGFQPSQETLVVLGRDDDMLNIGGVKIAPGPIEQRLKAIEGIRDALLISFEDQMGTKVMLVAIETDPDAKPAALVPQITPIVMAHIGHFQLMGLREFPRTETGKIQREAVRDLYRQQSQNM